MNPLRRYNPSAMDWWMLARVLKILGGICLAGALVYAIVSAIRSKTRRRKQRLEEKQRHERETLERMHDVLKERSAPESGKPKD